MLELSRDSGSDGISVKVESNYRLVLADLRAAIAISRFVSRVIVNLQWLPSWIAEWERMGRVEIGNWAQNQRAVRDSGKTKLP